MDSGSFPPNPGGSTSSSSPPRRPKQKLPAALKIPLAFQEKNQIPSPVRRKPLPSSASPLTPKAPPEQLDRTNSGKVRALQSQFSTKEPTLLPRSNTEPVRPKFLPPLEESPQLVVRDLDIFPRGQSPLLPPAENTLKGVNDYRNRRAPPVVNGVSQLSHSRLASDPVPVLPDTSPKRHRQPGGGLHRAATMASSTKPPPLHVDLNMRKASLTDTLESPSALKAPKTPGQKLTSFFSGWKTSSPGGESSTTDMSDGHSPLPSPMVPSPQTSAYSNRSFPPNIDTTKANSNGASYFGGPLQSTQAADPDVSAKLAEVETELKEISAELAASIKREMELEDLVEQLKMEASQGSDNRRTSDYFSDSGASSLRFPLSDLGVGKSEEMEKLKRRSELERARLKVDLSQKWQEEQALRKDLEAHVQSLELQIQQLQREKLETARIAEKARQLEASLEAARKRLSEEKQVKDNFQDLLAAMHEQIEQHKNDRDNLRDEVVPQLRARVEGLEAEVAESEKVTYDNARLQQEIQALRNENMTLTTARKMQMEMQQQASRISSIAEEGVEPQTPFGLKRSNSTARTPTGRGTSLARSPSVTGGPLSRSNSISGKDREAKESLADRIKDVEMQRDALHGALRSLLDRQAYQARENEKRIKMLEAERDHALRAKSPRRMGYEKEVNSLREEINHLRRRGDDALEQKWQCEKGLGGLKMDLDRAEQETNSLRSLLKTHDILLPDRSASSNDPFAGSSDEATSSSLKTALTHLEADRAALAEGSSSRSLAEERRLADQLAASSQHVQHLAQQVRHQLSTNHTLRVRLAEAVGRGEREQKSSTSRINTLQSKLKRLEDTVMVAQQQSEDSITKHESEVTVINQSHNTQLMRVKSGLRTPNAFSPRSPLSPMFAKTPKLDKTSSGVGIGLSEKIRTEFLEQKVKDLEKALKEADGEMEEVVGRMNRAQMEVAELQSDRDEAMRQTRRLQAEITMEREKVKALMG